MKNLLRRLVKFVAYAAGGLVILLAIAVGLFRLFLPKLPEYQENIKAWASDAIGMTVEFSGMDARWGLSGPEVEFYDAELLTTGTMTRLIAADEVSVGVGLVRLLVDRKFVVDHVAVRDTVIEVRRLENGEWWVQGGPIDQLLPARRGGGTGGDFGRIRLIGEDIELRLLQPGDERPRRFQVSRIEANRDDVRLAIDATVELPEELGRRLRLTATQLLSDAPEDRRWDVSAEIDNIELAGVTAMQPAEAARFDSGRGDVTLSFAFADKRVQSATATVDIDDIAIAGLTDLALSGRLEFLMDEDGWLLAADELKARTPTGEWPESAVRFEVGTDAEGKIVMVDAQASFLDFSHLPVIEPWLAPEQRALLEEYNPNGVVRNLDVTVSGIGTDALVFDASARFENLGIAAVGDRPGVRGLTGSLRADASGGRLELRSDALVVTAAKALGQPLRLDTAAGTFIWRRGDQGTTLLSDNIVLRNAFLDSETSVEVTIPDDGTSPIVDLDSQFSISDVATAGDYVPFMEKRPRISEIFRDGLLAGRVEGGRARLYGPVDKIPFEGDEGRMRIEWTVRDGVIIYQPRWPAAEVIEADVVIDNMSLKSERNRVVTVGSRADNVRLEIPNFRQPVMTFSADAAGSMEDFRQLCLQSPINDMFGGQLDRISVSGDASLDLELRVPVRDAKNMSFLARLQTSDAGMVIEGFDAPLTDISGVINIERDDVSSESLGATFLGEPVLIELEQAPDDMPGFRVIANAAGSTTVGAVATELGMPIDARASGPLQYSARLLFPRGNVETPEPFTIQLATDLVGVDIDLPAPLGKSADDIVDVGAIIFMPKGGDRIESEGRAGDLLAWRIEFAKDTAWDLDRGIARFGPGDIETAAETRGLHLRGESDYLYVQDWFDLARNSDQQLGIAERVRSIDMAVSDLYVLGQHLVDHRFRVDRGASEWIVQIDGERILGSFSIPYDFNSGQPIAVTAERLLLPGSDDDDRRPGPVVDPRSLPPVTISAGQLAFGNRHLGQVEAEFRHTADGLVGEGIVATDDTFEIVGNASWVIDETDPVGNRSFVTATITSTDVETTMRRLDYDPGIISDELSMLLDISWSGGPSERLLESLDGNVKVRIGAGQLSEVRPGAGRVFGLMSVAALPRRLALDFRDVFGKGFGFDSIKGDFLIVDGDTYTCNLSLEGPAADIGIVGRAGLVSREYEQAAVISANFGSALPVAGALVAGPQVAAALLIFSQIFRKPLKEVSQVYYGVSGSFDQPDIASIDAAEFAASGLRSGCITEETRTEQQ
ncbi:MAG TPA: YhdP family protein [Woeseiaceae bacterium]|jgi:uncharacterized protein (TIGR02099 family)|nr:YhdP family protein [Woeseiaceae bacterium]